MSAIDVKATSGPKDARREVTVSYDFGDNLAEAVEIYGEAVVFQQYKASATIDLQSKIRALSQDVTNKDGEVTRAAQTDAEITTAAAEWKPGKKEITRKSPRDKLKDILAAMSPEERASLLASAAEDL